MNSWLCNGCGLCCREFEVVLRFDEWLSLTRTYGMGVTKASLNSFCIGKKSDGSCLFRYMSYGRWLCGLQNMKPTACKLWPFKVLGNPRYGRRGEAVFNYNGREFFVYVDPFCPEIRWGQPSYETVHKVIPEFIEIALGIRKKQVYSTSMMINDLFSHAKQSYRLV